MFELRNYMSKRTCFVLFNLVAISYLIASGNVQLETISIVSYAIALALINGLAWISARKWKDWK